MDGIMEQDYSQYTPQELLQTIGQLHVDMVRLQVMVRHLQQTLQDKDLTIAELSSMSISEPMDESGS